jgi:general secretion pathway protein F/type IV pilus assembly protein PilC
VASSPLTKQWIFDMPEYIYEAMAVTGQRSQGTMTAGSEREVMAMLDSRGMYPMRIEQTAGAGVFRGSGRVKKGHLATFYSQLADLLHSGVPLLRSLDVLEKQSVNKNFAQILREVRGRVSDGSGLAQAMAQHPRAFDELTVSMVRAGQEGGFLEDVLKRVAAFTEHQEDLKAKVIGALAYPLFLMGFGTLVLLALVIFLVPQFEPLFAKLAERGEMPGLTVVVLGFSRFLLGYWWLILLLLGVLIYMFLRWSRSDSGRRKMDGFRLRIPLVGSIYLNLAICRFARILGTMLHNGIPILHALRVSKDAAGNKVLAEAIEKSAENIKQGDKLATPMTKSGHFPPDVVEMIAVGEESNSLEKVLIDISEGLEKRTSRRLELMVRMLEPLMLMVMAAVTLTVVLALLLPVFKMSSTMG